jgi:hypothetical protein
MSPDTGPKLQVAKSFGVLEILRGSSIRASAREYGRLSFWFSWKYP